MNGKAILDGLFGRKASRDVEPVTGGAVAQLSNDHFVTLFNAVLA